MEDHTYKLIELTGTSGKSMEDAVQNAISKASKTIEGLRWFQVTDTRGKIDNGGVTQWQVTIKVGFTLQ
ncbi:MAG TPA: dodecin [Balneolales bacterium]|nr:dodecin [Balneolales bacterium]